MRVRTVFSLLSVFILVLVILSIYSESRINETRKLLEEISGDASDRVWEKWLRGYSIVYELSKIGINVSKYVSVLQRSLVLLNKGEYAEAKLLLDHILPELENLYSQKDAYVFWSNVRKYGLATLIGSVPILFYFLFPRVYLWIWYKTREKWVVEE